MALPQRYIEKEFYTEEEYLSWEETAATKSEYVCGELRAMAGGTDDHATLSLSIGAELRTALRGRDCRVMSSDMKVWASSAFYYADVTVVCGPREYRGPGTSVITNPILLVEVLSPGTESKDRGEKFIRYQTIETLHSYLLVSQETPRVEQFSRAENGHWVYEAITGREAAITIPALSITLSLADIYDQIDFDTISV